MRSSRWAAIAVFVIALLALAPSALAADTLTARARYLPGEIHITGSYFIQNPAGCPRVEPEANSPLLDAWNDPRCNDYEQQNADLYVTVTQAGRRVYSETVSGLSGGQPTEGATYSEVIFLNLLRDGGCTPGLSYQWSIHLLDPYFRAANNVTRSGSFQCSSQ